MVLEGNVKVYVTQPDGTEVILAILGAGEIVGEMSLIDSLSRSADAVTQEDSTLLWIDRVTFWRMLEEMPAISRNLVNILSRRLRLANARTQLLASLDVQGRVAGQLLALAREYGEAMPDAGVLIPLRLTQSDLAGMVGASRVRVNQALGYYRKQNYLSTNRRHRIILHDPAALARHAR